MFRIFLAGVLAALVACSDSVGPEGTARPPALRIVTYLSADDEFFELGGKARQIQVRVVDGAWHGVPGVHVLWRVVAGGGELHPEGDATGSDGFAAASWMPGLRLDEAQVIEVSAEGAAPLRITAQPRLGDFTIVARSDSGVTHDTVGAMLRDVVRVRVLLPDGRPVMGARVDYQVESGGGRLSAPAASTDSTGAAAVEWQLGPQAGEQRVVAHFLTTQVAVATLVSGEGGRLLSRMSDSSTIRLVFSVQASPGRAESVVLSSKSVLLDAIGANATVHATGFDRYRNPLDSSQVAWSVLDSGVVTLGTGGAMTAGRPGQTALIASLGSVADTVTVTVVQAPARIVSALPDTINCLGDTLDPRSVVQDRLGTPIPGAPVLWRLLVPAGVGIQPDGRLAIMATGVAQLEASAGSVTDTLTVAVRQVVASLTLSRVADTVALDSLVSFAVTARDSNGFLVATPQLTTTSSDTTVLHQGPGETIVAAYPGEASLAVRAGEVTASMVVTVEGVAARIDGRRWTNPGVIPLSAGRLELSNGRVRLVWTPTLLEPAAVELHTRIGSSWYPGTATGHGDWLYPGSSVVTQPTGMELREVTPGQVALWLRFGDHRFDPLRAGFPSSYLPQPYPFSRTIWLRPGEYGYFTDVRLEVPLYQPYPDVEHEVGFGGLWGPARIRTAQVDFRTDTLEHTLYYNLERAVDAAEFTRDEDPLVRVVVPLQAASLITPVFPGWGYGSVYVYSYGPTQSYGSYLYAAPAARRATARSLCGMAWTTAPFALPVVDSAQLAACGSN